MYCPWPLDSHIWFSPKQVETNLTAKHASVVFQTTLACMKQ